MLATKNMHGWPQGSSQPWLDYAHTETSTVLAALVGLHVYLLIPYISQLYKTRRRSGPCGGSSRSAGSADSRLPFRRATRGSSSAERGWHGIRWESEWGAHGDERGSRVSWMTDRDTETARAGRWLPRWTRLIPRDSSILAALVGPCTYLLTHTSVSHILLLHWHFNYVYRRMRWSN